jgi:signal peptidase I
VAFLQWYMGFDFVERLLYTIAALSTLCFSLALLFRVKKEHWFREYSEAFFTAVWLALFIRGTLVEVYSIPSESMVPTLLVDDHLVVSKFSFGWHIPYMKGRILKFSMPKRGDIVIFVPPDKPQVSYVKRCVGVPGDVVEVRNKEVYINGKLSEFPTSYAFLNQADALAISVIRPEYEHYKLEHDAEYAEDRKLGRELSGGDERTHDWLGPYTTPKGIYYLGMSPFHQVIISRLVDLPAAGVPQLIPKGVKQGGIWKGLGNRDWFGPLTLQDGEYWMQGDDRDNSADSRFFGPVPEENLRGRPLLRYWPMNRIGFVK